MINVSLHAGPLSPNQLFIQERQARAATWFKELQDSITVEMECIDSEVDHPDYTPRTFTRTEWQRKENDVDGDFGGGRIQVLRGGPVFEKAGVAFANVKGNFPKEFAKTIPGCEESTDFTATGISLVFHPRNPHVPIVHMNTRFITTGGKQWFGGGADLTPVIPMEEDTASFHQHMKNACDTHDLAYYDEFKAWCDEYFYIKHRKETRGVGGIFYDYRFIEADNNGRDNFENLFQFTKDVGLAFLKAYTEITRRRYHTPYDASDLAAQFHKRTRYAEFNLVYDRGIKFGLNTGGNIEAMFMSLPPVCGWE